MINRILIVESHPRLNEVYQYYRKIMRLTASGTWGAVFQSRRHKVLVKHSKKVRDHFIWMAQRIIGQKVYNVCEIDQIGSAIIWDETDP